MQRGREVDMLAVDCRTFYLCSGNQPPVTGETETGKVLQGRTAGCLQKPEIQEDQRSGMDEKRFEHRKIRGQEPSLWIL